jgi:rubredoxin
MVSTWYTLSGPDNESHMCGSADRLFDNLPDLAVCPVCQYKSDPSYLNAAFRMSRRSYDLSFTYDGYCIASSRFMEVCLSHGLVGGVFRPLPGDREFFHLTSDQIVEFDAVRRKTRFERFCVSCGLYGAVAGATPAYLRGIPANDFSCTDLCFGSGNEKQPLIVVSALARKTLADERLRGPEFRQTAGERL